MFDILRFLANKNKWQKDRTQPIVFFKKITTLALKDSSEKINFSNLFLYFLIFQNFAITSIIVIRLL